MVSFWTLEISTLSDRFSKLLSFTQSPKVSCWCHLIIIAVTSACEEYPPLVPFISTARNISAEFCNLIVKLAQQPTFEDTLLAGDVKAELRVAIIG